MEYADQLLDGHSGYGLLSPARDRPVPLDGQRAADLTSGDFFPALDYRIALAFPTVNEGAALVIH